MLKDHLNKLEYFCIVIESKSLLMASKRACVSQPQLSKIVRQLEEELGTKLLVRSPAGIKANPMGDKLYHFAKSVIAGASEIQLAINSSEEINGVVRIGTYDSISRYFFPEFLKYLNVALPDLTVLLSAGRSHTMLKELQRNNLDLAVIVGPIKKSKALVSKIIYSDSFGLYLSPRIKEVFKKHLIVFPDSLRTKEVSAKTYNFDHILDCDNLETVKVLSEQGLGIGLLPHRVAREGVLAGNLIQYNHYVGEQISPHQVLLVHQSSDNSHVSKVIVEELERFLISWSAT